MTTTLSNLIDEVLINLAGYTYQQERSTYLRTAVTSTVSTSNSPTVLSLGSSENLGKGIIEIGEELMWVDTFDRVSNTATISPYGRGYLGTTASTAAADSKVTISPVFPRNSVKKAINDTIRSTGSSMFAVKSMTFTYEAPVTTYNIYDGYVISNVLSIMWQSVGPSEEWIPVRKWSWDSKADSTAFAANAQTITIGDYITPGRKVKVIYATDAEAFTSNSQDFATQTGLPESCKDVIILGAAYRLLTYLDPARAAQISPQADETDSKRPFGASNTATKQLYALYTQRLKEETSRQQNQYPIRVHYSR
jgi:hypothetical protein